MVTLLQFTVAGQQYGLDVREIVEVAPALTIRAVPGVPSFVAGLARYRGSVLPVVDLTCVLSGRPSERRFSTRLVVVGYGLPAGEARLLGLLVEHAAAGVFDMPTPEASGIAAQGTPALGMVTLHQKDVVQLVSVAQLLPESVRACLFVDGAPA